MISDVFCKIIKKELTAKIVAEGKEWLAIKDINPQAPVHVLLIPKKHIATTAELTEKDDGLIGKLIRVAHQIAKKYGFSEKGYRLITNCGRHGGQLVPHLHIHLLGGKPLGTKIVQN
jgi:histidine triad (HIT) family protein